MPAASQGDVTYVQLYDALSSVCPSSISVLLKCTMTVPFRWQSSGHNQLLGVTVSLVYLNFGSLKLCFKVILRVSLYPDLVYVTASGYQMCSYHLLLEYCFTVHSHVSTSVQIPRIIRECDITGGDIKGVWLQRERRYFRLGKIYHIYEPWLCQTLEEEWCNLEKCHYFHRSEWKNLQLHSGHIFFSESLHQYKHARVQTSHKRPMQGIEESCVLNESL